jgi:hypothetical protein
MEITMPLDDQGRKIQSANLPEGSSKAGPVAAIGWRGAA